MIHHYRVTARIECRYRKNLFLPPLHIKFVVDAPDYETALGLARKAIRDSLPRRAYVIDELVDMFPED